MSSFLPKNERKNEKIRPNRTMIPISNIEKYKQAISSILPSLMLVSKKYLEQGHTI